MKHYEAYQHTHNGNAKKKTKRNEDRKNIRRNNKWKGHKFDEKKFHIQETQQISIK